jgi:hypothetical protein
MRRISSPQTFVMKKVVPVVWLCVLLAIFLTGLAQGAFQREPLLLFTPVILLVIGISVYRKLIWDLADEVHDGGDFLKVRKGSEEDTIPLAGIINVSASTQMNPPRITLKLAIPGRFGDEIVFSPIKPFSFNVFAKNPTAEDLIMRVDAARRGLVRRH